MKIVQNSRHSLKRFLVSSMLALTVSSGMSVVVMENAYAQDTPDEGRQFGSKTGQIVLTAQEFMTADQYSAAIPELNRALALPEINPYERGVINQLLGSCYYETNQYNASINAFEAAIGSGGLLPDAASALRVNIAQLLIANDQPARGAQMLEDWSRNGGQLKPQYIEMLWQAWSQG